MNVLQLVVNGLMAGSTIMLPAIGLTVIFVIRRYINFALAGHMTVGAYAGYSVNVYLHWPALAAIPAAFLTAGLFGVITDRLALRPLAIYGALTASIASIALNLVLENLARFIYGSDVRSYDLEVSRDWNLGGLRLGPQQFDDLCIAVGITAASFVFLRVTPVGRAMRAVGDNATLADIKGIDPELMGQLANFFGLGLAGVGGMLFALETATDPELGTHVLLSVFAAAVVGGLGSIPGAVVGALAIGIFEELSLLVLPPTYRSVVGFVAILLVLTLRPSGLFGRKGPR